MYNEVNQKSGLKSQKSMKIQNSKSNFLHDFSIIFLKLYSYENIKYI